MCNDIISDSSYCFNIHRMAPFGFTTQKPTKILTDFTINERLGFVERSRNLVYHVKRLD